MELLVLAILLYTVFKCGEAIEHLLALAAFGFAICLIIGFFAYIAMGVVMIVLAGLVLVGVYFTGVIIIGLLFHIRSKTRSKVAYTAILPLLALVALGVITLSAIVSGQGYHRTVTMERPVERTRTKWIFFTEKYVQYIQESKIEQTVWAKHTRITGIAFGVTVVVFLFEWWLKKLSFKEALNLNAWRARKQRASVLPEGTRSS